MSLNAFLFADGVEVPLVQVPTNISKEIFSGFNQPIKNKGDVLLTINKYFNYVSNNCFEYKKDFIDHKDKILTKINKSNKIIFWFD